MRRLAPAAFLLAVACTGDPNTPLIEGPAIVSIPDAPPYPTLARMALLQGEVRVKGQVMGNGEPVGLVQSGGPPQLGSAALAFVRTWRFDPSDKVGMRPLEVRVRFVLREDLGEAGAPQTPLPSRPGWIYGRFRPAPVTQTTGSKVN